MYIVLVILIFYIDVIKKNCNIKSLIQKLYMIDSIGKVIDNLVYEKVFVNICNWIF